MKTTMEIYPGNRVEKLSKKQRRIKKSISTYARKLHASEVKIVFYWNEYIGLLCLCLGKVLRWSNAN